jgi:hypothetical protein
MGSMGPRHYRFSRPRSQSLSHPRDQSHMLAVPVSLNRSIAEDWQYNLRPYSPIREGSISPTRSQRKTILSTKVTASANTKTDMNELTHSQPPSPALDQLPPRSGFSYARNSSFRRPANCDIWSTDTNGIHVFYASRKGKLGLVLESSDQTSPFIKQAKDYSLLLG